MDQFLVLKVEFDATITVANGFKNINDALVLATSSTLGVNTEEVLVVQVIEFKQTGNKSKLSTKELLIARGKEMIRKGQQLIDYANLREKDPSAIQQCEGL